MENPEPSKFASDDDNRTLDELIEEAERSEHHWVIVFTRELLEIRENFSERNRYAQ